MLSDTARVPAGWYPDPLGLPQLRWWDNHSWTEHISDVREPLRIDDSIARVVDLPTVVEVVPVTRRSLRETERLRERAESSASGDVGSTAVLTLVDDDVALPETTDEFSAGVADEDPKFSASPEIGWAGAAMALHSIRQAPAPMILRLDVASHGTITVDTRYHCFDWSTPIEQFPVAPAGVSVSIEVTTVEGPLPFDGGGHNLDTLLWAIGINAFGKRPAPWLHEHQRYTLFRWPNITVLVPSMEQLRMTAMLANGSFSAYELAEATSMPLDDVFDIINSFSLMGVLRESDALQPSLRSPQSAPDNPGNPNSLFRRLRKRLGF